MKRLDLYRISIPADPRLPYSPINELTGTASSEDGITELGLTFWVGLAGIVLALLTSVCLLVKARHAGDGPFYGAGRLWVASGLAWVVWALAVRFQRLVCL